MIDVKHRRPIGFYERQFVVRNIGDFYTSFNVTGKYGGARRITPEILSNSLRQLIQKSDYWLVYNFFRTRDDRTDRAYDGYNYEVRPLEMLRYEDAVKYLTVDSFDDSILKMMNDLKPEMNNPILALWNVYFIETRQDNSQYVTFVCDHALLDGRCGSQFHKELLEIMNLLPDSGIGKQDILFNYEDEKSNLGDYLIPPREELTDLFQPSYSTIAAHYVSSIKDMLPSLWSLPKLLSDFPIFSHNIIKKDMTTNYRIVNFSTSELSNMLQFCNFNGFTLTPFLHVVALNALESFMFNLLYPSKKFATKNCITVDGRRFMPKRYADSYGCLVSLIGFLKPPQLLSSNKEDWISAIKSFHQEIVHDLSSNYSFKEKGLVKYTNVWDSLESKIGKREGRQTLLLSNLGNLKVPDYNDFTLEDAIFSSSTCGRYHFILDVISTEVGGLNVVFAYLPEYDEVYDSDGVQAMDNVVNDFKSRCISF